MHVNIEYSLEREGLELGELQIEVPLGTSAAPSVENADGTFRHDAKNQSLIWSVDSVDSSNATGSLEFQIAQRDEDAFFPVQVTFKAMETLCDVRVRPPSLVEPAAAALASAAGLTRRPCCALAQVMDVVTSDGEKSVRHATVKELAVESYTVQ